MRQPKRSIRLFLFFSISACVIWLVLLPWIAQTDAVEKHLKLLEERHIDASAMFYTELEPRPGRVPWTEE